MPEARDYRQTLALRKQQPVKAINNHLFQSETAQIPSQLAELSTQLSSQPAIEPKTNQVYVLINNAQEGPYTFDKIDEMLANGQINADTLLWHDGLPDWIPLNQMRK